MTTSSPPDWISVSHAEYTASTFMMIADNFARRFAQSVAATSITSIPRFESRDLNSIVLNRRVRLPGTMDKRDSFYRGINPLEHVKTGATATYNCECLRRCIPNWKGTSRRRSRPDRSRSRRRSAFSRVPLSPPVFRAWSGNTRDRRGPFSNFLMIPCWTVLSALAVSKRYRMFFPSIKTVLCQFGLEACDVFPVFRVVDPLRDSDHIFLFLSHCSAQPHGT